jgi:hypothetical protein
MGIPFGYPQHRFGSWCKLQQILFRVAQLRNADFEAGQVEVGIWDIEFPVSNWGLWLRLGVEAFKFSH